jgi:hypothetical protein
LGIKYNPTPTPPARPTGYDVTCYWYYDTEHGHLVLDYTVNNLGNYKTCPHILPPSSSQVLKYDYNSSGSIEKAEAMSAVNDYLLGGGKITKAEAMEIVNDYLLDKKLIVPTPIAVVPIPASL